MCRCRASIRFSHLQKLPDMAHALYRASISLHGAFGTPLSGDTLFGQLCWAAREHLGEDALKKLLDGYTTGRPWLVVSDGFPAGFLPKPTLPQSFEPVADTSERKAAKARRWIPAEATDKPLASMLGTAVSDEVAYGGNKPVDVAQPHNTLNRLSGSTGTGEFAPYTQQQTFFAKGQQMEIYLVLDKTCMPLETLQKLLTAVGLQGFGRDASIGLGKFTLNAIEPYQFALNRDANAGLTLAPCAPQGQAFDADKSYWRVITRFGRHGSSYALAANPFKTPVLLAATGALFSGGKSSSEPFIGQGLGGSGLISKVEPGTVQQGYAPVIAISMESLA